MAIDYNNINEIAAAMSENVEIPKLANDSFMPEQSLTEPYNLQKLKVKWSIEADQDLKYIHGPYSPIDIGNASIKSKKPTYISERLHKPKPIVEAAPKQEAIRDISKPTGRILEL